ncbi:MAG: CoA transferase [Thaumarchaeota archaeon]|nr:MAG: CoA transferase [Nitrososphaerota archaeon]
MENSNRFREVQPRLKSGPLEGIRVLELGTAVAGPLCAALLGDMGADVIKIEAPDHGDDSRRWGTTVKGESPYFVQYNRDKRSIALDIRREEGRAILLKLVRRSDVLIENFRAGTMKRLGLSYPLLRRLNRKIVYCSVSGFGQTGPYSRLGGYDAIIQALSGLMSVTGEANGPPLRVGVPITDILAALYAAFSVTLALLARHRTKSGQLIDVSLFESGVSAVSQWITISNLTGATVRRFGNSYPLLAPYELFQTKDRPIVVAVGNDELWAKLCRIIEREDLVSDPRFRSNPDRIIPANREILTGILQQALIKRPSDSWVIALRDVGIPAGVINSVEDVAHDPQLRARGDFAEVNHSMLGKVEIVAALPKFSDTSGRIRLPSPLLGEHTDEVLRELGLSRREILGLRKSGIIR